MNNGDMPASPTTGLCEQCCTTHNSKQDYQGLTKREAFAMAAMQGLIANSALRGSTEECSKSAVDYADSLLKELAK